MEWKKLIKLLYPPIRVMILLSLETAMFSQFGGDMAPENQRLMIILTGAGVSIIIVTMSVYSILKNSKEIKLITENKTYGE